MAAVGSTCPGNVDQCGVDVKVADQLASIRTQIVHQPVIVAQMLGKHHEQCRVVVFNLALLRRSDAPKTKSMVAHDEEERVVQLKYADTSREIIEEKTDGRITFGS